MCAHLPVAVKKIYIFLHSILSSQSLSCKSLAANISLIFSILVFVTCLVSSPNVVLIMHFDKLLLNVRNLDYL